MVEKKNIVCLGDSLTEGYGIDLNKAWPNRLKKFYTIVNSGISGDTTAGMLSRLDRDVFIHKPELTILMGGTNDIYFDLPINLILSNIKTMVRQLSKQGIPSIIGIPSLSYLSAQSEHFGHFINQIDYEQKLKRFTKKLAMYGFDDGQMTIHFNDGLNKNHFLEDGIHPDEKGHEIMAENAKSTIDQFFANRD